MKQGGKGGWERGKDKVKHEREHQTQRHTDIRRTNNRLEVVATNNKE